MPAWLWITAVALVAFAVFIALGRRWWRVKWLLDWLLVLSVPRWWYSWRHAAHVIEQTAAEYGPGTFYGSAILDEELTWRNSSPMTAELNGVPDWLPAPPVDPAPWLEQTRAELSPEALAVCPCGKPIDHTEFCYDFGPMWEYRADHPADLPERVSLPEVVLPDAGGWISGPCLDDPGPGDAAVIPPASSGPDQPPAPPPNTDPQAAPGPSRWLAEQFAILYAWSDWQEQKARIFA